MQPNQLDLATYQQAFLDIVYGQKDPGEVFTTKRRQGLQIYQHNLWLTAGKALTVTYPVLTKMLGVETINALAKRLLSVEKPQHGDWGAWGASLHKTIQASELNAQHPYLVSMAQLEWAMHKAGRAPEEGFFQTSLQRLGNSELSEITLQLAESVSLVYSDFPIKALHEAHKPHDEDFIPNAEQLGELFVSQDDSDWLVVAQQGLVPRVDRVSMEQHIWMSDVQSGMSLDELLTKHPTFDFPKWLSLAIEKSWITALN